MKLYHGTLVTIEKPVILKPTRTLDYGSGFLTFIKAEEIKR